MCGFAGVVKNTPTNYSRFSNLASSSKSILSRGPDFTGFWSNEDIELFHNRLAIQDLTQSGNQPFHSSCGKFTIVFNGEVYNFHEIRKSLFSSFTWRSETDTEVVLNSFIKYGIECLGLFRGMFAFAIWDHSNKKLFAARDRLGVKPLYFNLSDKEFIFGSRPLAVNLLKEHKFKQLDNLALKTYLESGYFPGDLSAYKGLRKLKPGNYLTLQNGILQTKAYWEHTQFRPKKSESYKREEQLIDELDELVTESVRLRMISDAPVGGFLSGGIDSSLVVAIMAKLNPGKVKAFTIGFDNPKYDESPHAKDIANYLGVEHYVENLGTNDLLNLMPHFVSNYDEPFFDSSAFPCLAVSKLAKKHVTVALSGDGGDEVFGGYHYYSLAKRFDQIFKFPKFIRTILSKALYSTGNHKMMLASKAIRQPTPMAAFTFSRSICKDFGQIFSQDYQGKHRMQELAIDFDKGLTGNTAEKAMRFDLTHTLPEDYMQKIDLASMAFSLEAREPLLDHKIVEWGLKLPLSWKIRNGTNKYLLRKLAYRYIPKELLDKPKMGFSVPIAEWIKGPLLPWAEKRLHDRSSFQKMPMLDQERVIKLFETHQSGGRDAHPVLWAVLMLCEFIHRPNS